MQGFSRFMEKYGEQVRDKFVNFTGKKDLKVQRLEYTPYTATKEVWDGIVQEFVQKNWRQCWKGNNRKFRK